MIIIKHTGNFEKTDGFLKKVRRHQYFNILSEYGRKGANSLAAATPVDTGKTADSWGYKVEVKDSSATITWTNSNINKGVPVALVIQYGHMLPQGVWVEGIDYINPALKPIFKEMADKVWKEITTA